MKRPSFTMKKLSLHSLGHACVIKGVCICRVKFEGAKFVKELYLL